MAGVSISAVSYIMNDSSKKTYSDSTIKKVKHAAKTLGYVPNNIARGMRSQKAKAIGVVSFWSMGNRVFAQTLEGIMQESLYFDTTYVATTYMIEKGYTEIPLYKSAFGISPQYIQTSINVV